MWFFEALLGSVEYHCSLKLDEEMNSQEEVDGVTRRGVADEVWVEGQGVVEAYSDIECLLCDSNTCGKEGSDEGREAHRED